MLAELLEARRSVAKERAGGYLSNAGFNPVGKGWEGDLLTGENCKIAVRVSLPVGFPDHLPVVEVDRKRLPRRVPHIEKSGKLCLAPGTGILLDTDNPEGIIRDSLSIAQRTLADGLSGRSDGDFVKEFLAYWDPCEAYLADCHPDAGTREIALLLMERTGRDGKPDPKILLADTVERGKRLIRMLGGSLKNKRTAFFVSLDQEIPAPDFEQVMTVRETIRLIRTACSTASRKATEKWFSQPVLPAIVILSIPNTDGRILVAIQFDEVPSAARKKAARGFRPTKVPALRELEFAQDQEVKRIGVDRYDAQFLLSRGGSMNDLQDKTVAVIGCGALGSHVIERLASLGVGRFRIVDFELLSPQNLYRHALGAASLGKFKCQEMGASISSRFLYIDAQARAKDIQTVLLEEPDFILSADLIVVALGDETLELRLDDLLGVQKPRLHTWVEPLGIGGHVAAVGLHDQSGCYRCLFHRTDSAGMTNKASFCEAGQSFQKSLAGCSGNFTPFAGIDADRTAIEVSRLAARILTGRESQNQLVSWFGDPGDFIQAGFRLSMRASRFEPGACKSVTEIADAECPHCAGRPA